MDLTRCSRDSIYGLRGVGRNFWNRAGACASHHRLKASATVSKRNCRQYAGVLVYRLLQWPETAWPVRYVE